MSFTRVSEIGEFGLIDRLAKLVQPTELALPTLKKGVGDDCAVIELPNGKLQVVSTDLLIEQIHFDLLTTPLAHLGAKAISVNVSDICAMNAKPLYATIGIGLSNAISVEMIEQIYQGAANAAKQYGVAIVGGDTSASVMGLVISVTIVGEADPDKIAYRSGAKVGDLICLTGDVGRSFAGLKVLMRERQAMLDMLKENPDMQLSDYKPDFSDYQKAIEKHLLPKARVDAVKFFHEAGISPTAMIDVSDGVCSELKHICRNSNVGALIEETKLPILAETREVSDEFEDDATTYALFGGEDYELLFTISPSDFETLSRFKDACVIGSIKPQSDGVKMRDLFGAEIDLQNLSGFQHFAQESVSESDESEGDENVPHDHSHNGHDHNGRDHDDEDIWGERKN
ncbi:MAG: thiamine-phosphate kinase [Chloroherpetonaceae bacterium]|nr:thiamine-phosphate kinase [Chloroherpetonaceae bacterium]MDW8438488.1 thiamine-phosphate kinase [Chloroherpetonaceae bacterium]